MSRGRDSLIGGELRAQHDVAEHRRPGSGVGLADRRARARPWEAHHVGRAGQVHPPHVQVGHRGSTQHHRQFGGLTSIADDEPRDADQFLFGNVEAGLVGTSMLIGGRRLTVRRWASLSPVGQTRCSSAGVGVDDLGNQPVPDHVGAGESSAKWMSSMPSRMSIDGAPRDRRRRAGRPGDVTGDDDLRNRNPSRVRNIFICSAVVFCASSGMMNASFNVRPRM